VGRIAEMQSAKESRPAAHQVLIKENASFVTKHFLCPIDLNTLSLTPILIESKTKPARYRGKSTTNQSLDISLE
jgi:hypothetical protein